jgi:hypothetical protein
MSGKSFDIWLLLYAAMLTTVAARPSVYPDITTTSGAGEPGVLLCVNLLTGKKRRCFGPGMKRLQLPGNWQHSSVGAADYVCCGCDGKAEKRRHCKP